MAVEFKDYYKILGVARTADDKAIKSAYRRLARKHHPDVAKAKDSGARFKEIGEAYAVLSGPEKRRRHDALGPDWQRYAEGPPGAPGGFRVEYGGNLGDRGGFSDFFRTIFGDLGARARPGGGGAGLGVGGLLGRGARGGGGGGGARGALSLSVTVSPHPLFERRGDDVHVSVPVTAPEAALGATLEVPTLRGRGSMKVPPATSSGRA